MLELSTKNHALNQNKTGVLVSCGGKTNEKAAMRERNLWNKTGCPLSHMVSTHTQTSLQTTFSTWVALLFQRLTVKCKSNFFQKRLMLRPNVHLSWMFASASPRCYLQSNHSVTVHVQHQTSSHKHTDGHRKLLHECNERHTVVHTRKHYQSKVTTIFGSACDKTKTMLPYH